MDRLAAMGKRKIIVVIHTVSTTCCHCRHRFAATDTERVPHGSAHKLLAPSRNLLEFTNMLGSGFWD